LIVPECAAHRLDHSAGVWIELSGCSLDFDELVGDEPPAQREGPAASVQIRMQGNFFILSLS
jgi:hypothetical protein